MNFYNKKQRTAYISPVKNGYITVYDMECENQDTRILKELSELLSKEFNNLAFSVLIHDGDIFLYGLFYKGKSLDYYNSDPGYFDGLDIGKQGGNSKLLAKQFNKPDQTEHIELILHDDSDEDYIFAELRHHDLVKVLGLPEFSISYGYNSLNAGDYPENTNKKDFIHTN